MKLATSIALIAAFAAAASASTLVKPKENYLQTSGNSRFIDHETAWTLAVALADCVVQNADPHHSAPLVALFARPEMSEEYKQECFKHLWEARKDEVLTCFFGTCNWDAMEVIILQEAANLIANAPFPIEDPESLIGNVQGCMPAAKQCTSSMIGGRQQQQVAIQSDWYTALLAYLESLQGCFEKNQEAKDALKWFEAFCGREDLQGHWVDFLKFVGTNYEAEIIECIGTGNFQPMLAHLPTIINAALKNDAITSDDKIKCMNHAMTLYGAFNKCHSL